MHINQLLIRNLGTLIWVQLASPCRSLSRDGSDRDQMGIHAHFPVGPDSVLSSKSLKLINTNTLRYKIFVRGQFGAPAVLIVNPDTSKIPVYVFQDYVGFLHADCTYSSNLFSLQF